MLSKQFNNLKLKSEKFSLPLIEEEGCMTGFIHSLFKSDFIQSAFCFIDLNFLDSKENIYNNLHQNEISYVEQLRVDLRIKSFVGGRLAVKYALKQLFGTTNFSSIEVAHGALGQPIINYSGDRAVGCHITHTNSVAAAIVYPLGFPIALDIEKTNSVDESVIKNQLNNLELRWIKSFEKQIPDIYFHFWTLKESLSKILLCGLTIPIDVLSIDKIQSFENGMLTVSFTHFSQFVGYSIQISENQVLAFVAHKENKVDFSFLQNLIEEGYLVKKDL